MAQVSAMSFIVLLITILTISIPVSAVKPDNRSYEDGEYIPLFANMLQRSLSPCEVYPYFSLPFCPPGNEIPSRKKSLDEVLFSDCFTNTGYELRFKEGKIGEVLCEKNLTKDEVVKFRNSVKGNFEFQMCFNNILMWGSVGKMNYSSYLTVDYYLVKHLEFDAYYIKNQVKDIRLRTDFDSAVSITEDIGIDVNFTYSVFWKDWKELPVELADTALLNRTSMIKYQWPTERGIAWRAIPLQLYVSVIGMWFLSLFLVIAPYLWTYFIRNSDRAVDEARQADVEEGRVQLGNRQIHGDACRCPPYSSLLGAVLGVGTQQLILICLFFIRAYVVGLNLCYLEPLIAFYLHIYCFTSAVSGYMATSFHGRYNATGWRECVFQTGVLYFVPAFVAYVLINFLRQRAIGFSHLPSLRTLFVLSYPWGAATIMLVRLGGRIGYASSRAIPQPLCATSRIPRPIPHLSWYTRTTVQVFLGGLIPFMTIFQDMDNIYASLHFQKLCGAFNTMFKAFIQVILMTALVGAGFTYIQLSQHDHQWWWRSVLRGGSTAIFMFIYGIYYFIRAMPGDPEIIFTILGDNACVFYCCFLALGTIGFGASWLVFHCMYRHSLKNE